MNSIEACVFDAYGTLFDIASAVHDVLGDIDSDMAARVAADWRQKQLQYTWILSMTGQYEDFWSITCESLDWALENSRIDDAAQRERILELYLNIRSYPEVSDLLAALDGHPSRSAILSNGNRNMLAAALDATGITGRIDDVFSVEAIRVFKPDHRVYAMVTDDYALAPDAVLFVSANGWDVAGAGSFGFRTVWINRHNEPVDRLPHRPDTVMSDLNGIADILNAS